MPTPQSDRFLCRAFLKGFPSETLVGGSRLQSSSGSFTTSEHVLEASSTMMCDRALSRAPLPEIHSGRKGGDVVQILLLRERHLQRLWWQVCCRKPKVAAACGKQAGT